MSSSELTEVNPVHLMATANNLPSSREVHVEGADSDQIVLHTGPQTASLVELEPKISQALVPTVSFNAGESNVGDGLLHPTRVPGPTRRNTTGTFTTPAPKARKMAHSHSQSGSPGLSHTRTRSQTMAGQDLHSHILKEAEQIRKEHDSKWAKEDRAKDGADPGNKVLVGNLIGEGHTNYVLMYNILNGIRISVSRRQAKLKHPLTDEDFTAAHKFSFDTIGNELTPSAKYDFKFEDYAPWVFRSLREEHFVLDPADYLVSLTGKYILSELGSPGKSGSFFYYSRDYRFIIKIIHHAEHKFLRKILPSYYAHVANNPHTLLSCFYGLHRVELPHSRKIHFIVMNNLFPAHLDIHETYDLKGSTVGHEYDEAKARENPHAVLKGINWIR